MWTSGRGDRSQRIASAGGRSSIAFTRVLVTISPPRETMWARRGIRSPVTRGEQVEPEAGEGDHHGEHPVLGARGVAVVPPEGGGLVVGEDQRARDMMEKLLAVASPLGLYAEEFDTSTGRHLGNFPQAFSHLALIEAAARIVIAEPPRIGL